MKLDNAVVLVTGANRGMGLEFARQALQRGARTVYAGARDPSTVTLPGVVPVKLDVTDPADIAAVAERCQDVTLLVNNAGIASFGGFLADDSLESGLRHFETNFYGPLRLSQAFAPILAAQGGGAILNMLSVASWITTPQLAVYAASKSAAWSMTNALRQELRAQKTQVLGVHVGYVDTDMTRDIPMPKTPPELVVQRALDALEAGADEVLADDITRQVKQGLAAEPAVYLQSIAG
jgi:NAD(P)-dependent dehydrogenase (short-subunit alcohol dehydrogenase family)